MQKGVTEGKTKLALLSENTINVMEAALYFGNDRNGLGVWEV